MTSTFINIGNNHKNKEEKCRKDKELWREKDKKKELKRKEKQHRVKCAQRINKIMSNCECLNDKTLQELALLAYLFIK